MCAKAVECKKLMNACVYMSMRAYVRVYVLCYVLVYACEGI